MKKRLAGLTVLVALMTSPVAAAESTAWGVSVRAVTNPDQSVTVVWRLENPNVFVTSITIDYRIVSYGTRLTTFRSAPLSAGSHTVTVEAVETFRSDTPIGSCETYGQSAYWLCHRSWHSSIHMIVPPNMNTLCLVPSVAGLRLKDASARITAARCVLGVITRKTSKRAAGTVLTQQPKPNSQLANNTPINLVVSNGLLPT